MYICRGDPTQLLKSVNPGEAAMLDAAARCHIRFRLGGDVPTIINNDEPIYRNFLL